MRISLIHPSRGRADKAFETFNKWIELSSKSRFIGIEHILSIDSDDVEHNKYLDLFESSTIVSGNNKNVVNATNIAAFHSSGDVLVYLSDDFCCPERWDEKISIYFAFIGTPAVLKVDDCLQKFDRGLITIPIMNRLLYEKLGYMWNPEYDGSFVDNDLFHVCKNNGWINEAPNLKFPHEHYSNGKAPHDKTYKRQDNNFESGKIIFNKRKLEGFPI